MIALAFLFGFVCGIGAAVVFACCVVSGRCSRLEEEGP